MEQLSTTIRTNRLSSLLETDIPTIHLPKNAPVSGTIRRPNENLPTKQHAPRSQKRAGVQTTCRTARIKHQSSPRFCFNEPPPEGASWLFIRLVRFLVSPRFQEKNGRGMMVLTAVNAVLAWSKPPAVVRVRISAGERHVFGAVVPLSTRAPSLVQGRAGGPVESSPKLLRHMGSVSTCAEELSPRIIRSAAPSSIRLRVLVSVGMSAFVARRGCRAFCLRPAKR